VIRTCSRGRPAAARGPIACKNGTHCKLRAVARVQVRHTIRIDASRPVPGDVVERILEWISTFEVSRHQATFTCQSRGRFDAVASSGRGPLRSCASCLAILVGYGADPNAVIDPRPRASGGDVHSRQPRQGRRRSREHRWVQLPGAPRNHLDNEHADAGAAAMARRAATGTDHHRRPRGDLPRRAI
jgi:hypothetical protein